MTEMVKYSNSVDELKLYLRLFPYSPYQTTFERKVFRLDPKETLQSIYKTSGSSLTSRDELTMSRLVKHSTNPKELQLFLKLFPNSSFRPTYEARLLRLETPNQYKADLSVEDEEEMHEQIENEILADSVKKEKESVEGPPPADDSQSAKDATEESSQEKEPEKKEESEKKKELEKDWAKIEIGIPTQLTSFEVDGNEVNVSESPTGVFIGWSHEVWFNIGGGTGLEYFNQKLESGELKHIYLEAQIRAQIFNLLNLGFGWGTGFTTIELINKPSSTEILPGEGTILTLSLGLKYGSFGLNYMTCNFTGSYQTVTAGSTSTIDWTGTVNMITLEYHY